MQCVRNYLYFNISRSFFISQFDEGHVDYTGDVSEEALKSFVFVQSLPLVVEFNHETATKIFGGEIKSHFLLFLSKKEGHFEKYLENAQKVAKDYRDKVVVWSAMQISS